MKFELGFNGTQWGWSVTDKKNGILAESPGFYDSEALARSAIAKARKGFAGAKFAKVEVIEPNPQVEVKGSYLTGSGPLGV